MVVVLVWTIQLIYSRKKFDTVVHSIDQHLVSPSDFTAMLYGMPRDEHYTPEDVKKLIEDFYASLNIDGLKDNVVEKVSIAYDIEAYTEKFEEYLVWMKEKRKI